MKPIAKVIVLFVLLFSIKLTQSCTENEYSRPIEFNYNKIVIQNIDNSGTQPRFSTSDSMYNGAVSLKITVMDSIGNYLANQKQVYVGFTSLNANEPPSSYIPKNNILKLNIISLEQFSPSIPANSDITEHFLLNTLSYKLYSSMTDKIENLNRPFGNPSSSFNLVLKDKIENNKAQFQIQIHLSDGKILKANTQVIYLKTAKIVNL